ncbi:MAG: hypothetical protein LBO08_03625 [Rickettsiales bacterium]|jgi:hypothetical protein|nr:hypothetical protein [Rickettsiales bacterium]
MRTNSDSCPVLYWPQFGADDSLYAIARRTIGEITGKIPEITSDLDIADFFRDNPGADLYYPVFYGSTGWWGPLLGDNAKITGKIILSPSAQLMIIQNNGKIGSSKLMAAEINPFSDFFKKMNSGIATSLDMLATDAGKILGLFTGPNQNRFATIVETTGNQYLGCIGGY